MIYFSPRKHKALVTPHHRLLDHEAFSKDELEFQIHCENIQEETEDKVYKIMVKNSSTYMSYITLDNHVYFKSKKKAKKFIKYITTPLKTYLQV